MHYFLEREELSIPNVMLVDFIGNDEQLFIFCKLDNVFDILTCQHTASWIARINDDQHFGDTLVTSLVDGTFKLINVQRPLIAFKLITN